MAGHSRSKNGVASLAYVPAIHALLCLAAKTWMPGTSPGMTERAWNFLSKHLRRAIKALPKLAETR
jgi:hypothetical protein